MIWRQPNETSEDLKREEEAASAIAKAWNMNVHKLSPTLYGVDWAICEGGRVTAFGEFKWRGHYEFEELMLSASKVWRMNNLWRASGLNTYIFVQWINGIFYAPIHHVHLKDPVFCGSNRGQNGDKEPCYFLPMRYFSPLNGNS